MVSAGGPERSVAVEAAAAPTPDSDIVEASEALEEHQFGNSAAAELG